MFYDDFSKTIALLEYTLGFCFSKVAWQLFIAILYLVILNFCLVLYNIVKVMQKSFCIKKKRSPDPGH